MPKKLAVGCLVVFAILVVAAVVLGTYSYTVYWRPLIAPLNAIHMQRFFDSQIEDQTEYRSPDDGLLSDEQVARFISIEQGIEARVGAAGMAAMTSAEAAIRQATKGRTIAVRAALPLMAEMRGFYIEAKKAQVDALNANGLSKSEYEWIRQRAFQAAGLDMTETDFADVFAAVEDARVRLVVTPAGDTRPDANVALAKPHAAELKRWLTLAFFGL